MTVNIPLLRKAIEWAEAEAAKPAGEFCAWNQGAFIMQTACGTAFCIAGYVGQIVDPRYAQAERVDDVPVGQAAVEALGIPVEDGCRDPGCTCGVPLFSATNTIEDVRRIAESLAGERL